MATLREEAAEHLLGAYRTREFVAPIIERFPKATIQDAYFIQQLQVENWVAAGDPIRGHKVGLVSAAMQKQAGVTQPDYGHLMQSFFHLEHERIPRAAFMQPRVEPEVAFVLNRKLEGPGVTVADAVRAIDFVLPSLEIIDSRITDWKLSIVDTIADNASSGGVVLGSTPVSLDAVDLRLSGCVLYRNGEVAATGTGGAVLGSPINSLVWLANTFGRLGVALEAGEIILPGSMTRAQTMHPGDTFAARFGGIGTVTAVWSPEEDAS